MVADRAVLLESLARWIDIGAPPDAAQLGPLAAS